MTWELRICLIIIVYKQFLQYTSAILMTLLWTEQMLLSNVAYTELMHSSTVYIWSIHALSGNQTHDPCIARVMFQLKKSLSLWSLCPLKLFKFFMILLSTENINVKIS